MRACVPRLSLLALLGAASCGGAGTDLKDVVNVSPFADAGDDAASADGGTTSFVDPFAGAPTYAAQTGAGSHNAGKACVAADCHGTSGGGEAPAFLFGGTVFADYKGATAAPGVEVRAVDAQGHAVSVFTGPEGNFFLRASDASGLSFPIVVGARDATTSRPMITTLATASYAACGQHGCHVPGGGGGSASGDYYPIHVP